MCTGCKLQGLGQCTSAGISIMVRHSSTMAMYPVDVEGAVAESKGATTVEEGFPTIGMMLEERMRMTLVCISSTSFDVPNRASKS